MPELPEVETIKRTLEHLVMNKRIEDITINWPKIIQAPEDIMHFKHLLMGEQINSMSLSGKILLFNVQVYVIVAHLSKEGKYRVTDTSEPMDKQANVIFHSTDGTELRYIDVGKFGTM